MTISIFILQISNYKKHFSDHKPTLAPKKKNPDENVRVLQSQAIKLKYSWSID